MQKECLKYTDSEFHQIPNSEVAPNILKYALDFLTSHHQPIDPTSIRMVNPKILMLHPNPMSAQVYAHLKITRDIHNELHDSRFHNRCPTLVNELLIHSPQANIVHNAKNLQATTDAQLLFLTTFNLPHDPSQLLTESPGSYNALIPK